MTLIAIGIVSAFLAGMAMLAPAIEDFEWPPEHETKGKI